MMNYLNDFFDDDTAERAGLTEMRPGKNANPAITGLAYDSRRVKPGNLYFALPGLHTDGHAYVDDAIKRGAQAILHQNPLPDYDENITYIRVKGSRFALSPVAAAFYGFPARHLTLIGVTGTEGKSTTVYLIYQLLRLLGKKAGFVSTVRYSHGIEETDNPEHQTTPEAVDVHRHLAAMRENGALYAVLECSSHGLSPRTNRLGDVSFDAAVMTNVTREHLEFHGTFEQYREDKSRLFRALNPSGFGVVNADDPSAAYFTAAAAAATAASRPVYSFSTRGGKADLSVEQLGTSAPGNAGGNTYAVRMQSTGKIIHIQDELPGAFNAGNVLAALITVSKILDVRIEEIVPLVLSLRPVRGRMTPVRRGQPFEVIVDYAHTPSSFEAIFPAERQRLDARGGRIISVFGSAGERDRGKRPEQGRIAADYSDIVILTDEDPRGENPMDILEEIAKGCEANPGLEKIRGEALFLIPNRPAAIREAFRQARPGDLVLLLGKGHENSIIYAKETMPYDESTEAEKALEEMGFAGEA